ncbi:MAG: hypothetical protein OEU54_10815 [Gemmatimonadota bacterium]|nr:hypothetical protein [Gemmatimonadota bacterium]
MSISVELDPEDWEAVEDELWSDGPPSPYRHARPDGADPLVDASEDASRFRYRYSDGTEFLIDLSSERIWGRTASGLTRDDTIVYLLGPVLGFVARSLGTLCLHASAVVLDDEAVLFTGPAGAGKSTLAASFATAGVPVLTDDIAALTSIEGGHEVEPGNSFIRLWPTSAGVTAGVGELPRLAPDWDKRFVDLTRPPYVFADEPGRLGAIYLLADSSGAPASVGPVNESEALLSLVGNTYANYMLTPEQRAEELRAIGRVLEHVDVRVLSIPDDLDGLARAMDAVWGDRRRRAGAA